LTGCAIEGRKRLEGAKEKKTDKDKKEFIEYLLADDTGIGKHVNQVNPNTGWRPIHWLVAHGELSLIKKLYEKGAFISLPESTKGFFPIDIAGVLGHTDVLEWLLTQTILQIEKKIVYSEDKHKARIAIIGAKPPLKCCKTPLPLTDEDLEQEDLMTLASPVLATNLLYWACYYNSITNPTVKDILEYTECYPEGPVLADKHFSPIHAAAHAGNDSKLKLLLNDYANKDRWGPKDPIDSKKPKRRTTDKLKNNNNHA
jgi:ankyrin repeat protein